MSKQRIIAVIAGLALLLAITGSTGIAADAFGLAVTPQTHACSGGNGGGGC